MKRDSKGKFMVVGKPRPSRGTTRLRKNIIEFLKEKGIYKELDDFLIKQLVEATATANALQREINGAIKEGKLVTEKNTLHPAIDGKKKTVGTIIQLCTKLGISPQDRAKLKLDVIEDEDELDAFMEEVI